MNFEKGYDIDYLLKISEYNRLKYESFKNGLVFEINDEYERILKARYNKVARIKRRLIYLFSRYNYIWFCTFTFNDNYINKSSRTKRDLIKRCISQSDFKYILNIDYGKRTEREHYHCILATNKDININDLFQSQYPSFSLSILCKNGLNDFKRLSKYINKLVNHCVKATTKKQRIVYNFKGFDDLCPTYRDTTIMFDLEYDSLFRSKMIN